MLMKESKNYINGDFIIMHKKTLYSQDVLPSLIYRLWTVPIKIPASYLVHMNSNYQKFIWGGRRPRIVHIVLKEKNKVGGLTPPRLQNINLQ